MKYFFRRVDGPEIHLYPLACWHIGSKQSCTKLIEEVISRIEEDPLALAIYMGDAGECVTRTSKGNVYEQTMPPGDQLRVAAKYLSRIRDKTLGGIRGNHGNRIDKETGVGWDEMLCERAGIPYFGVSAFGNIVLTIDDHHTRSFSLYIHHGSPSGISAGSKINAGRRPSDIVMADITLTAHVHICGEAIPPKHIAVADSHSRGIRWKTTRMYLCGSAYDSRSGYAEEKQYPLILPQHLVVKVTATRGGIHVSHETIDGFEDSYASKAERNKWKETNE